MKIECIDIESALMADGLAAPAMVCMAWSDGESEKLLVPWEGEDPYKRFESILRSGALLVNQHVFFDLAILCNERPHLLPLVFEAIATGQIKCVKVREQLIRIAAGQAKFIDIADDEEADEDDDGEKMQKTRFDLAAIAKRWLGIDLAKTDTWRLSYEILRGIPVARWPEDAVEYSVKDTRVALGVWAAQDKFIKDSFPDGVLPGEIEANQAAWALHLMKCWGVRTCPEAVAALTRDLQMKTLWTSIGLIMSGILRKGGTGAKPKAVETKSETQKRITAAFEARGENVPFTKPTSNFPDGQVKTAKKVLEDSGDKTLLALAEHKGFMKVLGTYIPRYVAKGIDHPITADWNPLVESFRVSCSRPNLTNPPRVGEVRNCFVSRPGFLYVSADFDQAELRSWAQVCLQMFGHSRMAEAFREGIDPHLLLAADLLKIPFEEAIRRYADGDKEVEDKRQFAKIGNFGLLGGMGVDKFIEHAASQKIFIGDAEAKNTKQTWKTDTWPEATEYLDYFSKHHSEPNTIVHPITGFYRGDCGYSDGANHLFQHLTAIGAKQALIDLSRECYLDAKSVLYGARPVIFMHDEIFGEIREEVASEGAKRWGDVMRMGMEKWIKDVPTKCTPVLTRRLYKGAKPVYIDGELVPSKPMIIDGKKKWVPDLLETSEMRRAA